jgi:hypothetical protein
VETPSRNRAKGKQVELKPASLPRGTRASRRIRDTEDEWQQVPAEWLGADPSSSNGAFTSVESNGNKRKKPADEDEESELSDLPDEDELDDGVGGQSNGHRGQQEDEKMDIDQVRDLHFDHDASG